MANDAQSMHFHQGKIIRNFERADKQVVAALSQCYSGFILDRMGKYGAMHIDIKPLHPGMKVCGTATTSLGPDLSLRRMAIDLAQSGDVLIVAAGGVRDYACFGDGTALKMSLKGMAGAVIDGSTRDGGRIIDLGFPTFARGITPRNYHYPVELGYGAVNVPVVCGGVLIHPGDVIFGDADGVVVIPKEIANKLAVAIVAEVQAEAQARKAMTVYSPFSVEEELKARGYVFE